MRTNHFVAIALVTRGCKGFLHHGRTWGAAGSSSAASPRSRHIARLGVDEGLDFGVAPLIISFAAVLAAAGKLQSDAMSGDQGLAAYLRDGSGYNKSGYKPRRRPDAAATAERLRRDLVSAANAGDASRAAALEDELTALLDASSNSYEEEVT